MPQVKPSNLIIDWGNPITKGLVFDTPFIEGSGSIKDGVFRTDGSIQSGSSWGGGLYGKHGTFSGTSSGFYFDATHAGQQGLINITVQAIFYSTEDTSDVIVASMNTGLTTTGWHLRLDSGQNAFGWGNGYFTNNPGWGTPSNTHLPPLWYKVIVTHDNMNLTTSKPTFYVNKTKYTTYSYEVVPTGSYTLQDGKIRIGANRLGAGLFNGNITLVRYWNRILTPTEIEKIDSDPWCIYQKPRFRIIDNISAAVTGLRGLISFGMIPFGVSGTPATNNRLLESGDNRLLESGDKRLLESN